MDAVPSARIAAVALRHMKTAQSAVGSGAYSHSDAREAARSIDTAIELLSLVAEPPTMVIPVPRAVDDE
jgi:hypothetical protein